jgi:signal transduction histidine kinase/PAS domain-containing protein
MINKMTTRFYDKLRSLTILLPLVLLLFVTIVCYFIYSIEIKDKKAVLPNTFRTNKLQESSLITFSIDEWLKIGNTEIPELILESQKKNRDLLWISVINSNNIVLISSTKEWKDQEFTKSINNFSKGDFESLLTNIKLISRTKSRFAFYTDDHKRLLILSPVFLPLPGSVKSINLSGTMISCYNFESAEKAMISKYRYSSLLYFGVFLFSSICLGIILYLIVIAPLKKVIKVMNAFSNGNWDARIVTKGIGEISQIYEQFNLLANSLKKEITVRLEIEEILKENTSNLKKAQLMARAGEWRYDVEEDTFFFSSRIVEIELLSKKHFLSEEYIQTVHPEDQAYVRKGLTDAIRSKNDFTLEFRRNSNRRIQYIKSIGDVNRDEKGKAISIFGVSMDITEEKMKEISLLEREWDLQKSNKEYLILNTKLIEKNEKILVMNSDLNVAKVKAEESDRLKSAFLANVSHEIRTPMNAIIGFSELLEDDDLDNNSRKLFTHTIRTRSADLLHIINDILDISRLESGTIVVDVSTSSITDELNELVTYYNTKNKNITKKPIVFKIKNLLTIGQDIISTDFNRLKQVLMNLIDNAFKFTDTGSIEIGCQLRNSNEVLFYVKDTGIGISENKLGMIFGRFKQATETHLTDKYGGTGLGLSISKGLIELLEGKIWVFFTIPYRTSETIFFASNKNSGNVQYANEPEHERI